MKSLELKTSKESLEKKENLKASNINPNILKNMLILIQVKRVINMLEIIGKIGERVIGVILKIYSEQISLICLMNIITLITH